VQPAASILPGRLGSLDAYRGFVMFLMMAEVLNTCRVSAALPDSGFWKFLCHHQSHAEWIGCSLHDLIQPSFSFLVGVALPFSLASRARRGQSHALMTWHALWRALLLTLLGVFLRSVGRPQTYWTFEDTLSQIGMGYFFLFLVGQRPARDQWIAVGLILVGYWAAFALYPLPGPGFDFDSVGVSSGWRDKHLLTGFAAHWNKNSNPAWAFDTWWLNLFPRQKLFAFNDGGYATLSFIPTLATMLLGSIAGGVLHGDRSHWAKVKWLAVAGVIGLASGALIGWLGICPVVKRIWTPSWVLYSGGWCFLLLAAFYTVIDVLGRRAWAFPLIVIGMNSIAAYCIAHLFDGFVTDTLHVHLGRGFFNLFGSPYAPLFQGVLVLLVFWLMLFWMYRRKLFLRI
jgi:heparan-alpha-glucosaminide N-acetyltransferase